MNNAIRNHSNYNPDDYAYLTAKGWSDEEILRRWDQEAAQGKGPCRWDHPVARAKLRGAMETRLREIEGDLSAYRNGWIQYDREHVRALQAERAEIIKSIEAAQAATITAHFKV